MSNNSVIDASRFLTPITSTPFTHVLAISAHLVQWATFLRIEEKGGRIRRTATARCPTKYTSCVARHFARGTARLRHRAKNRARPLFPHLSSSSTSATFPTTTCPGGRSRPPRLGDRHGFFVDHHLEGVIAQVVSLHDVLHGRALVDVVCLHLALDAQCEQGRPQVS